jgi:hypothetical protein
MTIIFFSLEKERAIKHLKVLFEAEIIY